MESNLSSEKARERKGEIRATLARLVARAEESGVEAILIAGDLFDSEHVSRSTERYVRELITSHPAVRFYYLAGNHDRSASLKNWEQMPKNLFLFEDGWTSFRVGEVVITGSERPAPETLALDPGAVNILLLHGQERAGRGSAGGDVIHLGKYKGKHIDYMALGHIHEHRVIKVDQRCTACYAGCLEGRGFDECGTKGYVLLEIEGGLVTSTFVPLAARTLHTVSCDVTGFSSQLDLEERVMAAVTGIPARDMVKVVLCGACLPDAHKDTVHLRSLLSERFWFAKVKDECRLLIRPSDYQNDVSLKGEFVRRVMASDLSEHEKERVIACGFRALSGEEVGF